MYGGVCALGILGVLQIVFPVCITVPITYIYELIISLIIAVVMVMMTIQKRTLRSYGVKVGKSIDIATIAVSSLCLLTMLGVFIYLNFFNERVALDEILVMFGAIGQKETFEYRFLQYSFYAVQIPLISSALMNFIHLLTKFNKIKNI